MKLQNKQVLALVGSSAFNIRGALHELNGRQRPLTKGEKHEVILGEDNRPIFDLEPYNFAPGVRMTLALILSKLNPFAEAFEAARIQVIKRYKALAREGDKPEPFNQLHPSWPDFEAEVQQLLALEVDIERLPKLEAAQLKTDENRLSQTLLMQVMPVLTEA